MSEMIVGILGFLTIAAIVVTLFKSKTLPSIAFIVFPAILAIALVAGGLDGGNQTGQQSDNQQHRQQSGGQSLFHFFTSCNFC